MWYNIPTVNERETVMELIIKLLFILAMFVFNVSIFQHVYNMKDEAKQKAAFMVLAGFNVLATSSILFILHPYMEHEPHVLAFAGFIGGAIIFAVSTIPYKS